MTEESARERKSEEREEREEASTVTEAWACICGFNTSDKKEFTSHLLFGGKRDGKGVHKSRGFINLETEESILPPWSERTDKQKSEGIPSKKSVAKAEKRETAVLETKRQTEVLEEAQEIKFISKVFTSSYTPIMRAAREAATRFWGWRADMPLENFLDTVIYNFFKEKGIILAGFIVEEEAETIEEKEKEEVAHGS